VGGLIHHIDSYGTSDSFELMFVTKCDICEKEIKGDAVYISVGRYRFSAESLCLKCGKPVADALNKIKDNKNGKQKRK